MSASRDPVLVSRDEREPAVVLVELNRPERHNAYDVGMRDALYEAFALAGVDETIRAVVIAGRGPSFCSGGDLAEFGSAPSPLRAREVRWLRDVWGRLLEIPAVTIAAVHGYAVGGGFEMAMLADLCIAADDAVFGLPETALGMIPGVGGTQSLSRATGLGVALELVVAGRQLSAREAAALGLVTRLAKPPTLRREALRCAAAIAALPAELVGGALRAVREGIDLPLAAGLRLERRLAGMAAAPPSGGPM